MAESLPDTKCCRIFDQQPPWDPVTTSLLLAQISRFFYENDTLLFAANSKKKNHIKNMNQPVDFIDMCILMRPIKKLDSLGLKDILDEDENSVSGLAWFIPQNHWADQARLQPPT
jgi:hypothetical protein